MEPIPVSVGDSTVLVPRLTVQKVIELTVLRDEEGRRAILEDASDAGLDPNERMDLLKKHREQRGLSSSIVKSAFSVDGAYRIVKQAMGGTWPPEFESMDPTDLSTVALGCLGIDLDEFVSAESSAEGKAAT